MKFVEALVKSECQVAILLQKIVLDEHIKPIKHPNKPLFMKSIFDVSCSVQDFLAAPLKHRKHKPPISCAD